MSGVKAPITQQPPPYGQGGFDNVMMQPAYQPMQVAAVSQPGETVVVQPMGMAQFPALSAQVAAGCPPGMEYIACLDKVSIFQVVHLSEGRA